MELTSALFDYGGRLLRPYERLSPPLAWTAPPAGTAALTAERARVQPWEEVLATEPETTGSSEAYPHLVLEQAELRAILELRRSVFDLLRSLRR